MPDIPNDSGIRQLDREHPALTSCTSSGTMLSGQWTYPILSQYL